MQVKKNNPKKIVAKVYIKGYTANNNCHSLKLMKWL